MSILTTCCCNSDGCADCSCIEVITTSNCPNLQQPALFLTYGYHPPGAPGPPSGSCYWGLSFATGYAVIYDDGVGFWHFYIKDGAGKFLDWTQPTGLTGPCPDFTAANWTLTSWTPGCQLFASIAMQPCAPEFCPADNTCACFASTTVTLTGGAGFCAPRNGAYTLTHSGPATGNSCKWYYEDPILPTFNIRLECTVSANRTQWSVIIGGAAFSIFTTAACPPFGVYPLYSPSGSCADGFTVTVSP